MQNSILIAKKENVTDENIVPLETGYAMAASYDADKSENKILYMDEDEVKRTKAGGLLRKVKRFVERTARIKTGSSLRIAGFELAPAK
jgi:oligoribonuclease (3'-5' exoribonuclease)